MTLAALLAIVFNEARANGTYKRSVEGYVTCSLEHVQVILTSLSGLPLPSTNNFVQNILENYIPTAIATLIEPLWVLINRLLCLLQPIEELQKCKAKAQDCMDLNYSSSPPQLVTFKALRARHIVLAAVCSEALLANILSIAFTDLFHHSVIPTLKSVRTAAFERLLALRSHFDFSSPARG